MYLPMTFHLESGEFSGNVTKTSELSFVVDLQPKMRTYFLTLRSHETFQRFSHNAE